MGSRLAPLLLAVFVATNLGYFLLDPEESRFFPWLGLYSLQFILLVVLTKVGRPRTSHILLAGLVARAILWFTVPVLESDYYRYLWDAHVYTHGINPYVYPPDDPALDPTGSSSATPTSRRSTRRSRSMSLPWRTCSRRTLCSGGRSY